MHEFLSAYIPDKQVRREYLDPDFWLSGAYINFETDTVRALPMGVQYFQWAWKLMEHNKQGLVQEACSLVLVPQSATTKELVRHAKARPREYYFMKYTGLPYFIDLPIYNPLHLSESTRFEMAAFADICPFLIDVLKSSAENDFRGFGDVIMPPDELRKYANRMPGSQFRYYAAYFPWLIDKLYASIEYDASGIVTSYTIQPVSSEFAAVGI